MDRTVSSLTNDNFNMSERTVTTNGTTYTETELFTWMVEMYVARVKGVLSPDLLREIDQRLESWVSHVEQELRMTPEMLRAEIQSRRGTRETVAAWLISNKPNCAGPGCSRNKRPDGQPLDVCSGCERKLYCSVRCQTAAWKQGGHKAECKKLAAENTAAVAAKAAQ